MLEFFLRKQHSHIIETIQIYAVTFRPVSFMDIPLFPETLSHLISKQLALKYKMQILVLYCHDIMSYYEGK